MQNRHIVLATIGSLGDLHPMLALGLELQQRGHIVTIATSEIYRQTVTAVGLGFHPIRPDLDPDDTALMQQAMDIRKGPEFLVRQILLPHLREMYDDLSAIAQAADLLIAGEVVYAAPIVAEKFLLKWASAILSPFSFFSLHDPSVIAALPFSRRLRNAGPRLQQILMNVGDWVTSGWDDPIQQLRAELGLAPARRAIFTGKYSPHFNLALFSPAFAKAQADWPANTQQTGFVFYDQPEQLLTPELQEFLDAGEPPIVFTLGSAAVLVPGNFYEDSVKALQKIGRRGILLMGNNAIPRNLPDNILATDYTPYTTLMPHAACVVHQGGIGTTAQALRAGCPQLIMPFSFDQPDNAARMQRLGAGLTITRKNYNSKTAAKKIMQLISNSTYSRRADEIATKLQAENGLQLTCNAIELQLDAIAQ